MASRIMSQETKDKISRAKRKVKVVFESGNELERLRQNYNQLYDAHHKLKLDLVEAQRTINNFKQMISSLSNTMKYDPGT